MSTSLISPFWVRRLLSQALRHEPATFGITLDDGGWADVTALLAAFAARDTPVTADELAAIVKALEVPTEPQLVAHVFRELLTTTFANRFRQIVFAIPEPRMLQHVTFAAAFPP